ncbi:MAG: hypothetical protein BGO41_12465 [Clostridiales bacterium 38-18]|nr:MAG: hypothetical protein BGO41_12465 [Clostridiales bacterium 38-18]
MNNNQVIMSAINVSKSYYTKVSALGKAVEIKAVNRVSFDLHEGETLGLIGESGSGKTTLSHLLLKLIPLDSGEFRFSEEVNLQFRKSVQIVFQYTYGALDPLKTVRQLMIEPLKVHKICNSSAYEQTSMTLLNRVGLSEKMLDRRISEISGGQKQRLGIARALATNPKIVVLDEPVSALDISVQGQIINLLQDLKKELGLTYLFITHDLKIARHLSDRLAVMKDGAIIEIGKTESIINEPKADYTRQLIKTINRI